MTGRYGNFFSHLLLEVPDELQVSQAIGTWDSDFWRRNDDDGGIELPDVHQIPPSNTFDIQQMTDFLSHDMNGRLLRFVLTAILSTSQDHRIVVAAPAESVAVCVYAVTRALPQTVLEDFSFSTYENEPLSCAARLIGTTWEKSEGMDLPSSCYVGSCAGFNGYSSRQTTFSNPPLYVDFVMAALVSEERFKRLQAFQKFWEQCQVREPDLIELSFRFYVKDGLDRLTPEEALRLLLHHELAIHCILKTKVGGVFLNKVISWAAADGQYFQRAVPALVELLRSRPHVLAQISEISDESRSQLDAWLFLDAFLAFPSFEAPNLERLGDAVYQLQKAARAHMVGRLVPVIADGLYRLAECSDVQTQLLGVLRTIGPFVHGGKGGLFCMIKLAAAHQAAASQSAVGAELLQLFGSLQTDIENILMRYGVEAFGTSQPEFDGKRQRAVDTLVTDDPQLDRTIAERRRTGFAYEGRVIRPEAVVVFVHKPSPQE